MRRTRMLSQLLLVEQRIFWRNRSTVFFGFMLPLMLLVLLAAFGGGDGGYGEVLVPAIAALTVASTTFQSLAIALAFHRDQGVLKRLVATPLPLPVLVGAKVLSTTIVAALEVVLVVVAGCFWLDLGWPGEPLQFALLVAVGAATFSALGFAVASVVPSGDSAPAITNAIYLPMIFLGGGFYDTDALGWFEWTAQATPLHHLVLPLRATWFSTDTDLAVHLGVLVLWCALASAFAARRFRWQPVDHAT